MKKIFIILSLVTTTLVAFAGPVQELMELAESAFSKGDYGKAKEYYSDIVNLQSATENQRDDARYNINICQSYINEGLYNSGYNHAISLFNIKQFVKSRNFCAGLLKYGKHRAKTNKLIQQCNDSINARFLAQQVADSIQRRNQLRDEYNTILDEALAYYNNKQYLDAINTSKKLFESKFEPLGESIPNWFKRANQIHQAQCQGKAITPKLASYLKNAKSIDDVHSGIARIVMIGNLDGHITTHYVSTKGDEILTFEGVRFGNFCDGFLTVRDGGYFDVHGNFFGRDEIVTPNFTGLLKEKFIYGYEDFSEDMAPFYMKNGKWGYLNSKFKVVIAPVYNYVTAFKGGFALVRKKDKWAFINKSGNELKIQSSINIPDAWAIYNNGYCSELCNSYFSDNLAGFCSKDKYLFINTNGEVILSVDNNEYYHSVINNSPFPNEWLPFSDGLIVCKDDDLRTTKFGFMNKAGEIVIPIKYDITYGFKEGVAPVKYDGKWALIDTIGREIVGPTFDNISWEGFQEGLCAAQSNGKWGYIDHFGDWIIEPMYDSPVGSFHEGLATVALNGQLGYVDKFGNSTFDFQ